MEDEFLQGLTGRIVLPCDPIYPEARQGFNRAVQRYPVVIVYCRTPQDVSNAVTWSRVRDVPLRVRSGGHNYEGFSNGDCALVIDLSEMNGIIVDEQAGLVRVEAGVANRELYEAVSSLGYPFPGGTCPTVRASGYALGGGWGLSCRYLGLGCDSLTGVELIDDTGTLIHASATENEELFWALRGAGGGNFGVVVALTFLLPAKVGSVTLIELDYQQADEQLQRDFLRAWQRWLAAADERMTLIARVYNSQEEGLAMLARGIFFGNPDQARAMLAPLLALRPTTVSLQAMSFLDAIRIIQSGYPPWELFTSFSRFVTEWLTDGQIAQAVQTIQQRAPGSVFAGLSVYALGGRVAQTGVDQTAYYYRDAKYILYLSTDWEDPQWADANRRWLAERYPVLAPMGAGAYVNFPWLGLPCFLEQYYGGHVGRLKQVKRHWDPCNVFSFPQGIRPEAEAPCRPFLCLPAQPDGLSEGQAIHQNHREFRLAPSQPEVSIQEELE